MTGRTPAGRPPGAAPPVMTPTGVGEEIGVSDANRATEPVLITDAPMSYEEELAVRKRRYKIMMGMRIPMMVLAVVFIGTPWLAVALLVASIPLPWIAVLIANDRLPRKREDAHRYQPDRPQVEAREHKVIDG